MEQAQIGEMRRVIDGFWRRPAEACDPEVKFVEVPGGWLRLRQSVLLGEEQGGGGSPRPAKSQIGWR